MAGTSPLPPTVETSIEQLSAAVADLAQNVRVLSDLVQETREEFQWISRNGIPHQPLTVRIEPTPGMPPSASDGGTYKVNVVGQASPPSGAPATIEEVHELFEWLGEHFTALHQEQLNLIVAAQEGGQKRLLAAITGEAQPPERPKWSPSPVSSAARGTSPPPPARSSVSRTLFPDEIESTSSTAATMEVSGVSAETKVSPADESRLPPVAQWEIGDAVELNLNRQDVWGEIVALDDAANMAIVQLIPSAEEVTVSQDVLVPERATARCGCIDPLTNRSGMTHATQASPRRDGSVHADREPGGRSTLESARATGIFSLARYVSVRDRMLQGAISIRELWLELNWLLTDRDEFCAHLSKRLRHSQLKSLAAKLGCLSGVHNTPKVTLARDCFHALLRTFALDADLTCHPAHETYEEVVAAAVERLTDDDLRAFAARPDHVDRALDEFIALLHRERR
ncbi:MAG: hypothetical protein SH850_00460 [Planctomycetaceae bacterium]|nr:hypothetical protein [Planctomycetaceae bacterium]